MKKILALSLVLMLAFSFMACNKRGTDDCLAPVTIAPAVTPTESVSDETPVPDGTTPTPTEVPTQAPDGTTPAHTEVPTQAPNGTTPVPTAKPTAAPTAKPTAVPTAKPTAAPTPSIDEGDVITFGTYEQDNNTSNGKEKIEWKVLRVEGNKAFVISVYALDCMNYNTSFTETTWAQCTLRSWLNNEFINSAFTTSDQTKILTTTVEPHSNPNYGTNQGNATQDKIFLLSMSEVEQYSVYACRGTAYTKAVGAYVVNNHCCWWLRTMGSLSLGACGVYDGGEIYTTAITDYFGVRPAMWIDISNL